MGVLGVESCLECCSCLGLVEGFSAWRGHVLRAGLQCPHSQVPHVLSPPEALTLILADSHQHLPVLSPIQTPSAPPGLELLALQGCSRAGFALDLV